MHIADCLRTHHQRKDTLAAGLNTEALNTRTQDALAEGDLGTVSTAFLVSVVNLRLTFYLAPHLPSANGPSSVLKCLTFRGSQSLQICCAVLSLEIPSLAVTGLGLGFLFPPPSHACLSVLIQVLTLGGRPELYCISKVKTGKL